MKTGINDLNEILFDVMDKLRYPDKKGKLIDVDRARSVVQAAKVVVEGYKVKANVINTAANCNNPTVVQKLITDSGLADK